ncbi:transposase [Streptomyces sp. W4I9-2]|nr:transposase [Streptomyces sp. W4I9-2]
MPDELWELFQRVVPEAPSRPQGGGRRRHGDREVLAAIVFAATSGCTWQQLPSASFSKIHLITERSGLLIPVGISGANLHDIQALIPLVKGIPPIRSRRGRRRRKPGKLHADKGYDYNHLRRWFASEASPTASPARELSPHNAWAATAGPWNARWHGSVDAAASTAATSAEPTTSWPSPASPEPSSANADSPNEMVSKR